MSLSPRSGAPAGSSSNLSGVASCNLPGTASSNFPEQSLYSLEEIGSVKESECWPATAGPPPPRQQFLAPEDDKQVGQRQIMEAKCHWFTREYTGRLVPDLGEPVPINDLVPWKAWAKWPREFEARDTFRGFQHLQPDLPEHLVWKPIGVYIPPEWEACPPPVSDPTFWVAEAAMWTVNPP